MALKIFKSESPAIGVKPSTKKVGQVNSESGKMAIQSVSTEKGMFSVSSPVEFGNGDTYYPSNSGSGTQEAAQSSLVRSQATSPLLSSDGATENRERWQISREARQLFQNSPTVQTAESLLSRYTTPRTWYAATGDAETDLILTKYISSQMEPEAFDWSESHDLSTLIGAAVTDQSLDGDVFTSFIVPSGEQAFRTQFIRGHLVGSEQQEQVFDVSDQMNELLGIKTARKTRFKEHGGIIVDSRQRKRAIAVYPVSRDQQPTNLAAFGEKSVKAKRISFDQVCHIYAPKHTDRLREVSAWSSAINNIKDLEQTWRYVKTLLKQQHKVGMIKKNKTGSPKPSEAPHTLAPRPVRDNSGNVVSPQMLEAGIIDYLETNESIEDLKTERPSASFFECVEYLQRSGSYAIDLPYSFTYEANGLNGGALRLDNNKAADSIVARRGNVERCFLNKWVRAKILEGIRNGALQFSAAQLSDLMEGSSWAWPELPTADEKYLNQITISLFNAGLTSGQDIVGAKSQQIDKVLKQKAKESDLVYTLAAELVAKHPETSFEHAVDSIRMNNPNGSAAYVNVKGNESVETGAGAKASNLSVQQEARINQIEEKVSAIDEQMELAL